MKALTPEIRKARLEKIQEVNAREWGDHNIYWLLAEIARLGNELERLEKKVTHCVEVGCEVCLD